MKQSLLYVSLGLVVLIAGCKQTGTSPNGAQEGPDQPARRTSGLQEIGILAEGME